MPRPKKVTEPKECQAAQQSDAPLAGRLGRLSLGRQLLALAIWPLLEQILSFMVNTVDFILATRMSEGEERIAILDALGLGGYVMWLMIILQGATATGVLAIVSRAAGSRNPVEARDGLEQGILAGLLVGTFSGLIMRFALPSLIGTFGLSPGAAVAAFEYLSILVWSCPILGIFYACTNALRAVGDTRTPFFIMLVINLANVALSASFVFLDPPVGGQGIAGLALGSLLGWVLGTIIVLCVLSRRGKPDSEEITLSLRGAHWLPQRKMMVRICRVGLPNGFEMFGMWLIHSYVIRLITGLPFDGALAAHIIAIRVESLSFMPGIAIGTASATLIGQYLGANHPGMALKALRTAWLSGLAFMSAAGGIFLLIPDTIVELILPPSDEEAVRLVALAVPLVFICGIFQPALATTMIMKTSLRGSGATRTVMAWSFTSLILFRVVGITLYDHLAEITLVAIWIFMTIDLFAQAIVFATISFKGKWRETTV